MQASTTLFTLLTYLILIDWGFNSKRGSKQISAKSFKRVVCFPSASSDSTILLADLKRFRLIFRQFLQHVFVLLLKGIIPLKIHM